MDLLNTIKNVFSSGKALRIPESFITRLQKKTKFSREKLLSFKKIYMSLLKPGEMELDMEAFVDQINILNNKDNKKLAQLIFKALDGNNNGTMGFDEFVWYFHLLKNGTQEERLTLSFNIMDVDNDGSITRKEIYDMITLMSSIHATVEGFSNLEHFTDEQDIWGIIDFLFDKIDLDKTGSINLREFLLANENDDNITSFFELLSGKGFEEIFSYQKGRKRNEDRYEILRILNDDVANLEDYYTSLVESRKRGEEVKPMEIKIGK